jgi:hypothetical protein
VLLERAAAEQRIVAAAHIPRPGRVERAGDAYRLVAL